MNHFEFLEKVKVGDEVFFTPKGVTIRKVVDAGETITFCGWDYFSPETNFKFKQTLNLQGLETTKIDLATI